MSWKSRLIGWTGIALCGFTLAEVNYPQLGPHTQLAIFALLGLVLVFLKVPINARLAKSPMAGIINAILVILTLLCFGYVMVQTEPFFRSFWLDNLSLGDRAGAEHHIDHIVALVGLVLVLEAARRTIGNTLPIMALIFIGYAAFGSSLPDWLFPHRGYSWERIVSQTWLHSQGVFGIALKVMFTYVFLFVIFGGLLEKTGATGFIIEFARRLFRNSTGGAAKVAVISSGMMGSLSGSAVANTATTGTFTIPMMRSSGFSATVAAAVEAAASSGGALAPPVMGAGAYMMLEIIEPQVTYLQIIKSALIPAILYYLALLMIVHFYAVGLSRKHKTLPASLEKESELALSPYQGLVFFGSFLGLILILLLGFTPFRAVSLTLLIILALSTWHKDTRMSLTDILDAIKKSALSGMPLISAASCVGIVVGVVTLTGIGSKLPDVLLPLAQNNLMLALILLMVSTIILGMGLPSAVCYLLMATLVGPVLKDLGVVPLAAHLFIFYFGMMSMVTPPVALAAYTAGTIAGSDIMKTGFVAFRFSLVGFALPFSFVLRPELLLLSPAGDPISLATAFFPLIITILGIAPLSAAVSGYIKNPIRFQYRILLLISSLILMLAPLNGPMLFLHGGALAMATLLFFLNIRAKS